MQQLLLTLIVALSIVTGQTLWKIGMGQVLEHAGSKLWAIATNVPIIVGLIIYAVATLLYMYVISKFKYGTSYAMIVSFSLIGATIMSVLFFDEKLLRINMIGIVVVIVGVVLVLQK